MGRAMTTSPDDALQTSQREVQRLLGRCLLRLQQYEKLIKAIVAHHEIPGPLHAWEEIRAERVDKTARKTLGTLVGEFLGSYIVAADIGTPFKDETDSPEEGFRIHLELSNEDFDRIKNDLEELVQLRNNLVHCFIDQHDIWSLDGCRSACDALVADYERIDQGFGQLREWAEDMERVQDDALRISQSDEFRNFFVNGIHPEGAR
jgi:hypothetical protein